MSDEVTPLRANHLLWLDYECSGVDENKDCIIEVGAILTTAELDVLWEFQSLVRPLPEGLGRLMLNPVVRNMHEKNGLLAELLSTPEKDMPNAFQVGGVILEKLVKSDCKQNKVALAGSGVSHYDRRFMKKYMADLSSWLRHWHIDIGTVRRCYEMFVGEDPFHMNNGKTHRALDDVRCHLEEAKAFADMWKHAAELELSRK